MLAEMPKPLTFSSFLAAMSNIIGKVSPANDLMNAFSVFEEDIPTSDLNGSGERRIKTEELREMLLESGMSLEDIDICFRPFLKSNGLAGDWFYYKDFINMLCSGDLDDSYR